MPKLDLDAIEQTSRTGYPPPYNAPMAKRHYRRLAEAAGLEDFGVSHVMLDPGGEFFPTPSDRIAFRLSYSHVAADQLDEGARRMARTLARFARG